MATHNFSIEFFPPKTPEGAEKLRATRAKLSELHPKYFSVTFGAGGTTQQGTLDTVREILAAGEEAAPHLSCVGGSRASIRAVLADFKAAGVNRIVALRGDLPSGYGASGEFRYANELVEFIRAETGDHFHIEVAAYPEVHPQARSPQDDLQAFARKVQAGATPKPALLTKRSIRPARRITSLTKALTESSLVTSSTSISTPAAACVAARRLVPKTR